MFHFITIFNEMSRTHANFALRKLIFLLIGGVFIDRCMRIDAFFHYRKKTEKMHYARCTIIKQSSEIFVSQAKYRTLKT